MVSIGGESKRADAGARLIRARRSGRLEGQGYDRTATLSGEPASPTACR
jgi:hypothetical protein